MQNQLIKLTLIILKLIISSSETLGQLKELCGARFSILNRIEYKQSDDFFYFYIEQKNTEVNIDPNNPTKQKRIQSCRKVQMSVIKSETNFSNSLIFQNIEDPIFYNLTNDCPNFMGQFDNLITDEVNYLISNINQTFEIQILKNETKSIKLKYTELIGCIQFQKIIQESDFMGLLFDEDAKQFTFLSNWLYYFVETDDLFEAFRYKPEITNVHDDFKKILSIKDLKIYCIFDQKISLFPYPYLSSDAFIYIGNQIIIKKFTHVSEDVKVFNYTLPIIQQFYHNLIGIVYLEKTDFYLLLYPTSYRIASSLDSEQIVGDQHNYDAILADNPVKYVFNTIDKIFFIFKTNEFYLIANLSDLNLAEEDDFKLDPFNLTLIGQSVNPVLKYVPKIVRIKTKRNYKLILLIATFLSTIIFLLFYYLSIQLILKVQIPKIDSKNLISRYSSPISSDKIHISSKSLDSFPDVSQLKIGNQQGRANVIPGTYLKANKKTKKHR